MKRRTVLAGAAAGTLLLAGCLATDTSTSDDEGDDWPPLQGGSDTNVYVDVPYREYDDAHVEDVRDRAEEIEYEELFRNVEDYVGTAVQYDAQIVQALEGGDYYMFLLTLDTAGTELIYGSWTGDRYLEGDLVRVWAEVIGTETYETGMGSENTVPSITIADIELHE